MTFMVGSKPVDTLFVHHDYVVDHHGHVITGKIVRTVEQVAGNTMTIASLQKKIIFSVFKINREYFTNGTFCSNKLSLACELYVTDKF